MGLRDIGHTLPPGFRFYPSDEELVCHYLYKKIANEQVDVTTTLVEVDLHTCEPWQLPDAAKLNSNEWYFFSFRDRKYATGFRTNRATISGYWKATGKDRLVVDPSSRTIVGMRKTLVFYKNRAPNGIKTGWIMHEFRLQDPNLPPKEDWVLCRVFHKSTRTGPECNNKLMIDSFHDEISTTNLSTQQGEDQRYVCSLPNDYQLSQNPSSSIALPTRLVDPMDGCMHHEFRDQMMNNNNNNEMVETKCDDDLGFLYDMDFEYSINGGELHHDDMRLLGDDKSSMIFI